MNEDSQKPEKMHPLLFCTVLLLPLLSGFRISGYSNNVGNRFKFNIRGNEPNTPTNIIDSKGIDTTTQMNWKMTKPEILAPAGGWDQLYAAINAGADAVYFGLQEGFNARARASNFGIHEIKDVMKYLKDRNKKGYLVMNILVFDEEFGKLDPLVREIASSGVDALIMQDLGAVDFIRNIAPNLPIHGR